MALFLTFMRFISAWIVLFLVGLFACVGSSMRTQRKTFKESLHFKTTDYIFSAAIATIITVFSQIFVWGNLA